MNILITAGPTREYLDDVRYLSNASTGRMGLALAAAAQAAGHRVVFVHGPLSLEPGPGGLHGCTADKIIPVTSAQEMFNAVAAEFPACDIFIACAAVSDYRPAERRSGKIKREGAAAITLELVQNPDIVREMAGRRRSDQVVIGFALETSNREANARNKLARKSLDAIVLNPATAIGSDTTEIAVFVAGAQAETIRCTKTAAAKRIIAVAERLLQVKRSRTN